MGKGIKAAAGSRLVVSRLRRNLREGMPAPAAIREVNRYMIAQDGSEEFATVDMAIIDPASCRASFYKMGAATSYLVRRGKVRLIEKEAFTREKYNEVMDGQVVPRMCKEMEDCLEWAMGMYYEDPHDENDSPYT